MINTETAKTVELGNGVTTVFPFAAISIFDKDDLLVVKIDANGVEEELIRGTGITNYAVTLSNPLLLPSIGFVTYPTTGSTRLQTGESLVIKRVVDMLQPTDLVNQGGYFPEVQEEVFDRSVMRDIQIQEQVTRSLKLPIAIEDDVSAELPFPEAGKVIGWNADEDELVNIPLELNIDNTALVVTAGVEPSAVDGRIWTDTSVSDTRIVRWSDGTDYSEIFRFDTNTGELALNQPLTTSETVTLNVVGRGDGAITINADEESASSGPSLILQRDNPNPAVSDVIGVVRFQGKDSIGNDQQYGSIFGVIIDPTSTSEDGYVGINTTIAGTQAEKLRIGGGLYHSSVTGGDKGTGTLNFTGPYYQAGVPLRNSTTSAQTGTTHTPAIGDHGKTFYYSNASGCTVTLPTISSVFDGFGFTMLNLIGDAVDATDADGTLVTVNRGASDEIDPTATSFTIPARKSYNKQEVKVVNGKWFTMMTRWKIYTLTYTAGGSLIVGHALGVQPDQFFANLVCTATDNGYEVGDKIAAPTVSLFDATTGGHGALMQSDNDILSYKIGSNGIFAHNETTGVTTTLTDAKWVVHVFIGY